MSLGAGFSKKTAVCVALSVGVATSSLVLNAQPAPNLDMRLEDALKTAGFTGTVEKTRQPAPNEKLRLLGRDLFFDKLLGLHKDNSCAGCHAPQHGFADTQSIAIGVENNDIVGPGRRGPRNQRRTPGLLNTAFYPALMWNGRFSAPSGDPFDNSEGFVFPAPEGSVKFPPYDSTVKHLLAAQGHIPPTELPEMAGFNGVEGEVEIFSRFGGALVTSIDKTIVRLPSNVSASDAKTLNSSRMKVFSALNDGDTVPAVDASLSRAEPIRTKVLGLIWDNAEYRKRFGDAFPDVAAGAHINFDMVGIALAEFQIGLTRANAPIDKFARGERGAGVISDQAKEGALIFFGKGNCVSCHAVSGQANEMFSDFKMHNIGVPPLMPGRDGQFKKHLDGNVEFDLAVGDVGLADIVDESSKEAAKYKFRTSPLRNVSLQPTFMHNGAYTRLEDAVRHHLDVVAAMRDYDADKAGVASNLRNMGPKGAVMASLAKEVQTPISLTTAEFDNLVAFLRDGLTDERATTGELCKEVPTSVPSGMALQKFEGC